jgi:ABC-2 type transport system ATP-binding protein
VGYLPGELALYGSLSGTRTLDMLARLHPRPPVLRGDLLDVLGLEPADLRRPVRQYSRGMKQKLGLVAALQHDPPLAILDEPTGGLDPVVQLRLMDWLGERARAGTTIVFSSHVLAEVESLCDRVAMVRDGRLLLVNAVEDLHLSALRRVTVRFAGPAAPAGFAPAGVRDAETDGAEWRCTLSGPPAPLLAALAALPVEDVVIAPFTLEDAFRALYRPEGAGA